MAIGDAAGTRIDQTTCAAVIENNVGKAEVAMSLWRGDHVHAQAGHRSSRPHTGSGCLSRFHQARNVVPVVRC